jgi:hypothetical protein
VKSSLEPRAFSAFCSYLSEQIDIPPSVDQRAELLPPGNKLSVDGQELTAIYFDQTAVPESIIMRVPRLRLTVCGPVAYGAGHPMLACYPPKELRQPWIKDVEKSNQLGPA